MALFGGSKSTSSVANYTTTNTENTAIDNRMAVTDGSMLLADGASFEYSYRGGDTTTTTTTTNFITDGGAVAASADVAMGAVVSSADLAKAAMSEMSRSSAESTKLALQAAEDASRNLAAGYDGALKRIGEAASDALAFGQGAMDSALSFGRSTVDEALGYGKLIAQSNEDLADRAITAVMDAAADASRQSGAVVNSALNSMIEADKSSEERAFQNITKMVVVIAIAAAAAYAIPRLK